MLPVVWSLTTAVASAFGIIFIAELGDKTQLLALGFGARHRLRTVLAGLVAGYAVASAFAALVGGVLGAALPERPIALTAGALFLVVAAVTALDRGASESDGESDGEGTPVVRSRHVVMSIAVTIAIAELGDKTQLATVALAANANPLATWLGATSGEVAAGMVGALAGRRLGSRLDARILTMVSAVVFAVVGVVVILTAW
ncbi:MAG: TMEM165/GDT1 family protein [Ilumatobacteraceae bacterium]